MKKLTLILLLICALAAPPIFAHGFAMALRSGTSDPGTCQPTGLNVFINRNSTPVLKICTAANTWTGLLTTAGGTLTAPLLLPNGSATAPSWAWSSDADGTGTGAYRGAANSIWFAINGSDAWAINASKALVCGTDGGCDIGNGASDPRDVNITRHFATAGLAFASLGTPADGTFTYCTDCTQANPCAGSSSGAFARRENGAWNCGSGAGATYTALTAGSLTVTNPGSNGKPFVATWNNVHVNALGAVASGDIKVATLPAKTYVKNAYITITAQEAVPTTLTVSLGRTAAGYIDYIVASDAKAAANTIYGDASGERGTNLTGYDYPSRTATTDVYIQFVATGDTMDNMLDTSGEVVIEYMVIP